MSSTTAPTNPISPISHSQSSPQSSADAFSSRIKQAIDLHFHTSETNAVLPLANDPVMDSGNTTDTSHDIDLTSDCNSSRHESSTRSETESDWSDTEDISQEILDVTDQINDTVEARKWLSFIDHHLHKILHGLAQIEGAAVQVARTTNSAFVFSDNIYHLKEQVMLFHMCQQHKVEESYGEQALLRSKVKELQELSDAQFGGYKGLSWRTNDLSTKSDKPPTFAVLYTTANCIIWPEFTIHGPIAGGIVLPDTAVHVVGHDFIIRVTGSRPGPRANECIRHDAACAAESAMTQLNRIAAEIKAHSARQTELSLTTRLTEEDTTFRREIANLIRHRFPIARQALCDQLPESVVKKRLIILQGKYPNSARWSWTLDGETSTARPDNLSDPPLPEIVKIKARLKPN
ncbi:hypothetical protein FPRO06_11866 [Fusarium proliferatum]|nr:hypothetical protein FPRO06_11866 [Fusarium proliferatum]